MRDLPAWATLAFSGVTFAGGWAANEFLKRGRTRALATRDAAIDIASYLTSLDGLFPSLVEPAAYPAPSDDYEAFLKSLAPCSSTWELAEPVTDLRAFLASQDDEQTHRLAILFFDRAALFRGYSRAHYEAFMWLVDNVEYRGVENCSVAERLDILADSRTSMLAHARDLLRFGNELLEVLVNRASTEWAWRLDTGAFAEFMIKHYGLTPRALAARRAYYASEDVVELLSDSGSRL